MLINNDTYDSLADKIGMARSTFSSKINGHTQFTIEEAKKISQAYHLTDKMAYEIFLT